MNDFSAFAEHSVKKSQFKHHRKLKIIYSILITLLIVGVNVFLSFLFLGLYAIMTLIITLIFALAYCNKIFAPISYDYRITEGEIYFSVVYNGVKRKEIGSFEIAKFEAIAPYKDNYKASADRLTYVKEINMTSSPDSEGIYYAVLSDPEDHSAKTIFFFEPNEKMLKLMKFYNRNTVIPRAKAE